MESLPFGTLLVGDCFFVDSTLLACAVGSHVLRKVDGLHAEYVDGSGTVLVPEGAFVGRLDGNDARLHRGALSA